MGTKSRVPAGERELIGEIRRRSTALQATIGRPGILRLGIGDDCAILRPRPGREIVLTTDLSLENVHFRRDWHPPRSVGHRCLARGLSDLAAMGARPEAAFLSLALPAELSGTWLNGFLDGFIALAERHNVPLAGGDLARSANVTPKKSAMVGGLVAADIVLVGSVSQGKALLRSGARAGDVIYVTGTLGGSAAELEALALHPRAYRNATSAGHPHLYPEPRLEAGQQLLARKVATAAIDVSDGLSTDLAHLCEETGLTAEIDAAAVPVDARASLKQALHGGEDYELLFTARKHTPVPAEIGGVSIHAIGRMRKGGAEPLIGIIENGVRKSLRNQGWQHFA